MLFKYATRAEVDRGCFLAHDLKDGAIATAKNGFSVVGAVPITRGEGAEFPGTNGNYITLPVGGRLNKTELSFVIEFWPNFAANDGAVHNIFVSSYSVISLVAGGKICLGDMTGNQALTKRVIAV